MNYKAKTTKMDIIIQNRLSETMRKFLRKFGLATFEIKEFYTAEDLSWTRAEIQLFTATDYPILKIIVRTQDKGVSWSCGEIGHTSRIDDIHKILQTL